MDSYMSHNPPWKLLFTRLCGDLDRAITTTQYRNLVENGWAMSIWIQRTIAPTAYAAPTPHLFTSSKRSVEAVRELLG